MTSVVYDTPFPHSNLPNAAKTGLLFLLICFHVSNLAAQINPLSRGRDLLKEAIELCDGDFGDLAAIAELQARAGDVESSKVTFDAAWRAAELQQERQFALNAVVELRCQAGQLDEAIASSLLLQSAQERALLLGTIAIQQADRNDPDGALQTLALAPNGDAEQRNGALQIIAMGLSDHGNYSGALRALSQLFPGSEGPEPAQKVPNDEQSSGDQLKRDAENIWSVGVFALAEDQAETASFMTALQTARRIRLQPFRDRALSRVGSIAADAGDVTVAQIAGKEIFGQDHVDAVLVRIIAALAKQSRYDDASQSLDTIVDEECRANACYAMAKAYAGAGLQTEVDAFLDRAKALNPDAEVTQAAMQMVAIAYASGGHFDLAEELTKRIADPRLLSMTWQELATAKWRAKELAGAQDYFDLGRDTASRIDDPYERSARLKELAIVAMKADAQKTAEVALARSVEAARQIEIGGGTDVLALVEIASAEARLGRMPDARKVFQFAADAALKYPDEPYIAELLGTITAAQADVGDVEFAIQQAHESKSKKRRLRMLLGIANSLLPKSAQH